MPFMMNSTPAQALKRAITNIKTATALASEIGVTSQAISQWDQVPAERVLAVERATGVSRYELRPDIYGPPPETERQAS